MAPVGEKWPLVYMCIYLQRDQSSIVYWWNCQLLQLLNWRYYNRVERQIIEYHNYADVRSSGSMNAN